MPVAFVLQSGFDALRLKKVDVAIESYGAKKQLQIDRVLASTRAIVVGGNAGRPALAGQRV